MGTIHRVQYYNEDKKLVKEEHTTTIVSADKPTLIIKHWTDKNKFVCSGMKKPYPEELLPEWVKKKYAYLFEKKDDAKKPVEAKVEDINEVEDEIEAEDEDSDDEEV